MFCHTDIGEGKVCTDVNEDQEYETKEKREIIKGENDIKNVQRKVKKFLHMAQLDVGVVGVVHGAQNIL